MSSETVELPAPQPGAAAQQPRLGQRPEMTRPEASFARTEIAGPRGLAARLAAEVAPPRHVPSRGDPKLAILPLRDEPFDLPGPRAVVRYLPASHDSRVGGDWY